MQKILSNNTDFLAIFAARDLAFHKKQVGAAQFEVTVRKAIDALSDPLEEMEEAAATLRARRAAGLPKQ